MVGPLDDDGVVETGVGQKQRTILRREVLVKSRIKTHVSKKTPSRP